MNASAKRGHVLPFDLSLYKPVRLEDEESEVDHKDEEESEDE